MFPFRSITLQLLNEQVENEATAKFYIQPQNQIDPPFQYYIKLIEDGFGVLLVKVHGFTLNDIGFVLVA